MTGSKGRELGRLKGGWRSLIDDGLGSQQAVLRTGGPDRSDEKREGAQHRVPQIVDPALQGLCQRAFEP